MKKEDEERRKKMKKRHSSSPSSSSLLYSVEEINTIIEYVYYNNYKYNRPYHYQLHIVIGRKKMEKKEKKLWGNAPHEKI